MSDKDTDKTLNKTLRVKPSPGDLRKFADSIDEAYLARRRNGYMKKTSFSPSQFYMSGKCARRWYYAFNGTEWVDTSDVIGIANQLNGGDAGKRIAKLLSETPYVTELEEEVVNDDPPIRGFIDFMLDIDGEEYVGEVKTTRHEAWVHRQAKKDVPDYQLIQLLIYLQLKDMRWGLFLIESKNTFEHLFVVVDREEYQEYIDEVFEWMREVYAFKDSEEPPKRPYRKNSKECKGCPFRDECFADVAGVTMIERLPEPTN